MPQIILKNGQVLDTLSPFQGKTHIDTVVAAGKLFGPFDSQTKEIWIINNSANDVYCKIGNIDVLAEYGAGSNIIPAKNARLFGLYPYGNGLKALYCHCITDSGKTANCNIEEMI